MAQGKDKDPGSRHGGLIAAAACGLVLVAFAGLLPLNQLTVPPYRSYGRLWRDRIGLEEAVFFAAIIFLATPAVALLVRAVFRAAGAWIERILRRTASRERTLVAFCMAGALGATAAAGLFLTNHSPLTNEEQVLMFQAELLDEGRLSVPEPPLLRDLDPSNVWVKDGRWTAHGQWGHAALLAAGAELLSPFLVPHLCAPLLILLVWLLARELFPEDRRARVAATALLATSPYLIFMTATLNPAVSSATAVLLGAWLLARHARRGGIVWAVLAGLAFGLDLHVRPVNGAVLGGVCAGLAIAVRMGARRSVLATVVGLAAGLAPWIALHALLGREGYETFLPAAPFVPTVAAVGRSVADLLRFALWSTGSLLAASLLLTSWRHRGDWLLLVPVAALFIATVAWDRAPEMEAGPAAYFDVLPFFLLYAGRAISAGSATLPAVGRRALLVALPAAVVIALVTWWPVQGAGLSLAGASVSGPYRLVDRIGLPRAVVVWHATEPARSWVTEPRVPTTDERVTFVAATKVEWLIKALGTKRHLQGRRTFQILQSWGSLALLSWRPPQEVPDEEPICLEATECLPEERFSRSLR